MSTKVQKVYADGELVYDISGEVEVPPDPPDPLPEGSITFSFAEIPEQVFIYGYSDEEEMNIYHLDTLNLFPSGSMPWDGANGFSPRLKCDIVGTLPPGLTWNRDTGKFVWDGRAGSTNTSTILSFTQVESNETSDQFIVKILSPTVDWAYSDANQSLEDAVNEALPDPSGTNVVFIRSGEYQDIKLRNVGNGYMNCFNSYDNLYIIGEPGTMPILSGNHDDWDNILDYDPLEVPAGETLRMRMFNITGTIHLKGIAFRCATLAMNSTVTVQTTVEKIYINKCKLYAHIGGVDGTQFAYIYGDFAPSLPRFISNFETYWMGAGGTKHPIYNHSSPYYSDENIGSDPKCDTYVNNYKAYEMKRAVGLELENQGGQMYKDFGNRTKIRNSFFSMFKTPSNIYSMTNKEWEQCGQVTLLTLHAHMRVVLYNNEFHGWNCDSTTNQPDYLTTGQRLYRGTPSLVNFQNRGLTPGVGSLWPPYFSYPAIGLAEENDSCRRHAVFNPWENYEFLCTFDGETHIADKDITFHGPENVANNYTINGAQFDELPNPNFAPTEAPYWETLGDVSVPTNTKSYSKFLAHNRFYFYPNVPYVLKNCNAIQVHSSVPKDAYNQFNNTKAFLPCPPNWIERNYVFTVNNEFTGFDSDSRLQTILMGKREEEGHVYPYAPDQVDVVANNLTEVGGEIQENVGEHIAIPAWFKI